MAERNTFGILGDPATLTRRLKDRVIDIRGRDSRRAVDRFNHLLDFYADRVVLPPDGEPWSIH